jgi:hypothetical protein
VEGSRRAQDCLGARPPARRKGHQNGVPRVSRGTRSKSASSPARRAVCSRAEDDSRSGRRGATGTPTTRPCVGPEQIAHIGLRASVAVAACDQFASFRSAEDVLIIITVLATVGARARSRSVGDEFLCQFASLFSKVKVTHARQGGTYLREFASSTFLSIRDQCVLP